MAKASAEGGATHYVREGAEVPEVPPGVRLVGPGAPIHDAMQRRRLAATPPAADPEPAAAEAAPASYDGLLLAELAEECRGRGLPVYGTKADLAARLEAHDKGHQ